MHGGHNQLLLLHGSHIIAALLVLLYLGELLGECKSVFPFRDNCACVLCVQTSSFIAGGREHDGCV